MLSLLKIASFVYLTERFLYKKARKRIICSTLWNFPLASYKIVFSAVRNILINYYQNVNRTIEI